MREVRDPEATAVLFDMAVMLDWIDPLAETVALGVPAVIIVASDEIMDTLPGELLREMPYDAVGVVPTSLALVWGLGAVLMLVGNRWSRWVVGIMA